MKYIVTGCAGFIGSNLCDELLKQGHTVVGIDDLSTGLRENLPISEKFTFINCDILNTWSLYNHTSDLQDADCIFHLAAQARIQPTVLNPKLAHDKNITGIFNILETMRKFNIKKIIFSSSSSIYGLKNKVPLKEDMINDCLNPYSLSKFIGEQYIKMYCKLYGIQGMSLRYFNVWGPREVLAGQYAPVIGIFFRQVLQDKNPLTIIGMGEQKRDFTYVSDVVSANIKACESVNEDNSGMVLNVGSGINYTINKVSELVLNSLGINKDYKVYIPPRPAEAFESLADISLAKEIIGWEPRFNLENKINEHKDYYLNKWNFKY